MSEPRLSCCSRDLLAISVAAPCNLSAAEMSAAAPSVNHFCTLRNLLSSLFVILLMIPGSKGSSYSDRAFIFWQFSEIKYLSSFSLSFCSDIFTLNLLFVVFASLSVTAGLACSYISSSDSSSDSIFSLKLVFVGIFMPESLSLSLSHSDFCRSPLAG